MKNKWKIASFVVMGLGLIYNLISDYVEDKNSEERMREIVKEELDKVMPF